MVTRIGSPTSMSLPSASRPTSLLCVDPELIVAGATGSFMLTPCSEEPQQGRILLAQRPPCPGWIGWRRASQNHDGARDQALSGVRHPSIFFTCQFSVITVPAARNMTAIGQNLPSSDLISSICAWEAFV